MEIAAFVISCISLISTIGLTIWEIINNVKTNAVNLQSVICEKVFDKFLIEDIPQARRFLKFDSKNNLTGGEKLNNVLVDIRNSSLYFRYNDRNFYDKLDEKLTELEDYLTNLMNKVHETTKHAEIYNKIDEMIKEIYLIIYNKKING